MSDRYCGRVGGLVTQVVGQQCVECGDPGGHGETLAPLEIGERCQCLCCYQHSAAMHRVAASIARAADVNTTRPEEALHRLATDLVAANATIVRLRAALVIALERTRDTTCALASCGHRACIEYRADLAIVRDALASVTP